MEFLNIFETEFSVFVYSAVYQCLCLKRHKKENGNLRQKTKTRPKDLGYYLEDVVAGERYIKNYTNNQPILDFI